MEKEHGKRSYAYVGLDGGKRKRGRIDEVAQEDDDEGEFVWFIKAISSLREHEKGKVC
jgi:hypothetical protein